MNVTKRWIIYFMLILTGYPAREGFCKIEIWMYTNQCYRRYCKNEFLCILQQYIRVNRLTLIRQKWDFQNITLVDKNRKCKIYQPTSKNVHVLDCYGDSYFLSYTKWYLGPIFHNPTKLLHIYLRYRNRRGNRIKFFK